MTLSVGLGPVIAPEPFEAHLRSLVSDHAASRLFARDATLWGPQAATEAAQRLGWVDAYERATPTISAAMALRDQLTHRGIRHVVLCGMGGSSLAPLVITQAAHTPLTVLDSTHPRTVARVLSAELSHTVVVVSSKSGSTVETRSHLSACEAEFHAAGLDAAEHIVIVTDPGSPLEAYARVAGYPVFLADPDVGGRYSALTPFGIVPSTLAGADLQPLMTEARAAAEYLCVDTPDNPAMVLAAALAAGLPRQYLCLVTEQGLIRTDLGLWVEQLVAESTGKLGRGVLPVALPMGGPSSAELAAPQSIRVTIDLSPTDGAGAVDLTAPDSASDIHVSGPLGAQFLLWEVATALLSRLIKVNPFDQPDVESAKVAARNSLETPPTAPVPAAEYTDEAQLIAALREKVPADGYIALQAYVDEGDSTITDAVERLRHRLSEALRVPVALGYGPRYLHSTGQFHKGGPAVGVFVQIVDLYEPAHPVGGIDFAALIMAQAAGDKKVLTDRGRPVSTFRVSSPAV